jgi:protein-tyrosine phosphatase
MRSILTVCVGNICRSPMAEGLLRRKLGKHVSVTSAGLNALVGSPVDQTVQDLMNANGIDVTEHRARQVIAPFCMAADLILVMEDKQKVFLQKKYPFIRGKTFRLGEFGGFDVDDPYRREHSIYEKCLDLVDRGVSDWIKQLSHFNGR